MAVLGKGCGYFKSFPGILKIIEFVSFVFSSSLKHLNDMSLIKFQLVQMRLNDREFLVV